MPRKLRLAYIAHSLRSDWNNGNAHFLRGLLRSMASLGHNVTVIEPETEWSIENLRTEPLGEQSLAGFSKEYTDLRLKTYTPDESATAWLDRLRDVDVVVLHEWNAPELARRLVDLRDQLGFKLLFHDTHHRASSSPEQIRLFQLDRFDGIVAFGQALEHIYRDRFGLTHVWTLHEAADTSVFRPLASAAAKTTDIVWIGNWGDGERSAEIRDFLVDPLSELPGTRATIYGVRYPADGLEALERCRHSVWRVSSESMRTSGLRFSTFDCAHPAPAVCLRDGGNTDDSCLRSTRLRYSSDLCALAGCRKPLSRG